MTEAVDPVMAFVGILAAYFVTMQQLSPCMRRPFKPEYSTRPVPQWPDQGSVVSLVPWLLRDAETGRPTLSGKPACSAGEPRCSPPSEARRCIMLRRPHHKLDSRLLIRFVHSSQRSAAVRLMYRSLRSGELDPDAPSVNQ